MTQFKNIGRSTPLLDGKVKVTGHLRYAPDLKLPGMLHARFVTSPYAHARINGIDVSDALQVPGVMAVLTAADLPDIAPTARNRLLLARDRVMFVGQPVALVLSEDPAAAVDGVERVWVDYDPLPAAVTLDEAMAPDAPLVWPNRAPGESGEAAAHGADVGAAKEEDAPGNVAERTDFTRGDIDVGLAEADVIVENDFTTPMIHQSYLETFSILAQPNPLNGGATIWTSTQAPFYVREEVADMLGVEESLVKVVGITPGGAFGGKFMQYEPLVALAARQVNRPVRFVLTRSEDMLATNPAPHARFHVKMGARKDGTLTALQADITFDVGCYPSSHGIAAFLLGSWYQAPHMDIHYTEVMTFKVSTGAYRAPGAPQAAFALESVMDDMARALGMDPLAFRLKNVSEPGDPMANGNPWPNMGARKVLETLRDHPSWQNRSQARAAGRGVGIAIGGWPGGTEPAAAACQLHRDGTLHVHIGSVDLTGSPTGFALIAAEAFGIAPEKVRVITGDTDSAAFAGAAGGSKVTYMVGPAVIAAANDARLQTIRIAADELEADEADIEIVDGRVQVKGVPDKAIDLADIAKRTMRFGGKFPPVVGNGRYAETTSSPGFCAQLAEVDLDAETGQVQVHRLVVVQDVGRALNPMIVEGQMMGGATQGLGWALYEQMIYDPYGQPLTGTWMDYTVPHFDQGARKLEPVIVEVPSDKGPFGARGIGEPPVIATAAAVANAIRDLPARHDGTGPRLTDLPMTPARVQEALAR